MNQIWNKQKNACITELEEAETLSFETDLALRYSPILFLNHHNLWTCQAHRTVAFVQRRYLSYVHTYIYHYYSSG